jgi:hypothetical protein
MSRLKRPSSTRRLRKREISEKIALCGSPRETGGYMRRALSLSFLAAIGPLAFFTLLSAGCASGEDGGSFFTGGAAGSAAKAGAGGAGNGTNGGTGGGGWPDAGGHAAYDSGTQDAGTECVAGDEKPCYTGPTGTEGVGVCLPGKLTCQGGLWRRR